MLLRASIVNNLIKFKHATSNTMPRRNNSKKAVSSTSEQSDNVEVKLEPEDVSIPDLNQFKYERKPHVKIEFDDDDKESPQEPLDSKGLWEPNNWREFLVNLRLMRSEGGAPVDSMGCHKAMDENAPPKVMRYQSLIALMLSSQTKDQVTFAAMERLRARGLTVDSVLEMTDDELGQLIYPVGFWKTKIKYIKKTSQTLKDQYNGDIPDSVEKLCKLTGVGPKMAHICMSVAWNKVTGIGVDTHVHRISNRIGWVKKSTSTPEDTRKALESWLPFELWGEVNHLLVGFGQTICQPISPLCNECLNKDICPSSGLGRKSPNKRSPKKTPVKEEVKTEGSDDDFETKNEDFLDVPKKLTKKKVTLKKKDLKIEEDNLCQNTSKENEEIEKENDYKEGPNIESKKTNKRKVTSKKSDSQLKVETKNEHEESTNKRTRSKKNVTTKANENTETLTEPKLLIKRLRKSPRIKETNQIKEIIKTKRE